MLITTQLRVSGGPSAGCPIAPAWVCPYVRIDMYCSYTGIQLTVRLYTWMTVEMYSPSRQLPWLELLSSNHIGMVICCSLAGSHHHDGPIKFDYRSSDFRAAPWYRLRRFSKKINRSIYRRRFEPIWPLIYIQLCFTVSPTTSWLC